MSTAAQSIPAVAGSVSATPIGMVDDPRCAIDPELLHAGRWVADVAYRPLQTALTVGARERRCSVRDGGWMAVDQAVHGFDLETGLSADAERMSAHFLQHIAQEH